MGDDRFLGKRLACLGEDDRQAFLKGRVTV
jgi:hypothetical protein